ncbi:hypothetical protein [Thermopirellula anaerolimosa]
MESQNDLGQTIRGLLLLGIFVVLPVTAAVFPSVCRLAWRDAYDGTPASAESPEPETRGETPNLPTMSMDGMDRETKFPPQERSATIPAEIGNPDMASGWGGAGDPQQDGGNPALHAIATPNDGLDALPSDYSAQSGMAAGFSNPSWGPSRETSMEGWPDRNSIGPGYTPPGTRETSFSGTPPGMFAGDSWEAATVDTAGPTSDLERRLQALGAVYYRMEKWGAEGRLYRFYCDTTVAGQPGMVRHWEAVAEHPESAMIQVISQIEAARDRQEM